MRLVNLTATVFLVAMLLAQQLEANGYNTNVEAEGQRGPPPGQGPPPDPDYGDEEEGEGPPPNGPPPPEGPNGPPPGPDGPPPPNGPPGPPPEGPPPGPDGPPGPPPPDGPDGPPPPPQGGEDPSLSQHLGCWLKAGSTDIGVPASLCGNRQEKMGLLCYESCPREAPKYFALSCVNRPGHWPKMLVRKTHVLSVCGIKDGKAMQRNGPMSLCFLPCPPGYKRIAATCWQDRCPKAFPHRCGVGGTGSLCARKPSDCGLIKIKFKFDKFDYGAQATVGVKTAFKTCDALMNQQEQAAYAEEVRQQDDDLRRKAEELQARLAADAKYFADQREAGKRYSLPDKCAKYTTIQRGGGTHSDLGCWINARSVGAPSIANQCEQGYTFKHGLCHAPKPPGLKCFGLICGSSGKGTITLGVRKPPKIPNNCAPGKQKIGLLCYDQCMRGWRQTGLFCTRDSCPAGYKRCGLMCMKGDKCGDLLSCLGLKTFDVGLKDSFGKLFKFPACEG